MARVLRIVNRFNVGGPTYNAAYLTKYLPDPFETLLVGGVHDAGEASSTYMLEELGVSYRVIESMKRSLRPADDRRSLKELRRIIREFNPTIVHTHASKAGALGRRAALKEGVPILVHTFHGHVFENYFGKFKTSVYKGIEKRLAKETSAIVVISQQQKRDLCHRFKVAEDQKTHVIPLGFDLLKFQEAKEEKRLSMRHALQAGDDRILIGTIGRMAPIKNQALFIDAIAGLKKDGYNVCGVMIGDGELRADLEKQATELGLRIGTRADADLVFMSWIKDVPSVIHGLDMVVLTSDNEGTPVSLVEAQAGGVPVVSTDVGGVADTMASEESGILVGRGDLKALVTGISRLIDDPELRKAMGEAGIQFANQRYSYRRLVSDMTELYNSLLDAHPH